MKKIIILLLAISFTAASCNKQQINNSSTGTAQDVYQYQLGGFEVKYPKGWQTYAAEDNTSSKGCVSFAYPSAIKLAGLGIMGVCYAKNFELDDYLKSNINKTQKTTMGALAATQMSINPPGSAPRIYVVADEARNGLTYSIYFEMALKTTEQQYLPAFQAMQSSFKLLK